MRKRLYLAGAVLFALFAGILWAAVPGTSSEAAVSPPDLSKFKTVWVCYDTNHPERMKVVYYGWNGQLITSFDLAYSFEFLGEDVLLLVYGESKKIKWDLSGATAGWEFYVRMRGEWKKIKKEKFHEYFVLYTPPEYTEGGKLTRKKQDEIFVCRVGAGI